MGLYLSHSNSSALTWLAINAEPLNPLSEEQGKYFPWDKSADRVALCHISPSADPKGSIAVAYSKQEFKRLDGHGRWYSAPRTLVQTLLGQAL